MANSKSIAAANDEAAFGDRRCDTLGLILERARTLTELAQLASDPNRVAVALRMIRLELEAAGAVFEATRCTRAAS